MALSVIFSATSAVELSSPRVAVIPMSVLGVSTFVMNSVTGSVEIASVSFGGAVTGALVVTSVVGSIAAAIVS